jgi:hypothetical protein
VDAGFDVVGYDRAPNPEMETAFEQQAAEMMATAAGPEIAHDVRDVVAELRPGLMVVDCMLPAGVAAGESTGTPTASLVHFSYGLARTQMLRGSCAWTTDPCPAEHHAQRPWAGAGSGRYRCLGVGRAASRDRA